jgi:MFS family permease
VAGLWPGSPLLAPALGGHLLKRFGRRSVTAIGASLIIPAVLSLFIFPRLGMPFLTMDILQGFGASLVNSPRGFIADLNPPGARAQVSDIYTVWMNLPGALMLGAGEAIKHRG